MTTNERKLTKAQQAALRAFYFHTTSSYTGGDYGDVERLNEAGGTLYASYRYMPAGIRPQTMNALRAAGLVEDAYRPHSTRGSKHYQLTASGHAIVRNLLTDAERAEIDTYLMEQAMAEDLIRDRLAYEAARGIGDPQDASRTTERGRMYWVDYLMREGFQDVQQALSDADRPADYDSVRRALTAKQAARHPGLSNAVDDRMPDGMRFVEVSAVLDPPHPDWKIQSATPVDYIDEIRQLTLPELIDRYARTYHRAANQPNNAELDAQCTVLKLAIARTLEGWVPAEELNCWATS